LLAIFRPAFLNQSLSDFKINRRFGFYIEKGRTFVAIFTGSDGGWKQLAKTSLISSLFYYE